MEYMLKILDLEREIEKLKVVDRAHAKYVDLKKKLRGLDNFGRKVSEMDLKEADKRSFLKRVEEYKSKIEEYRKAETRQNNKNCGIGYAILSFLFGIACFALGIKLKKAYKLYKNRRIDEMANYIYEKLSNEKSEVEGNG